MTCLIFPDKSLVLKMVESSILTFDHSITSNLYLWQEKLFKLFCNLEEICFYYFVINKMHSSGYQMLLTYSFTWENGIGMIRVPKLLSTTVVMTVITIIYFLQYIVPTVCGHNIHIVAFMYLQDISADFESCQTFDKVDEKIC